MFDKNLFDRNAYDRSVASGGITGSFQSTSTFGLLMDVKSPVVLNTFTGQGIVNTAMVLRALLEAPLSGGGTINDTPIVLRQAISINMTGEGNLKTDLTVKTPFQGSISGGSAFVSTKDFVYQYMSSNVTANSLLVSNIIFQTEIGLSTNGSGDLQGLVGLQLSVNSDMHGSGDMILRRIGALNENTFELLGINLQPGEEVTIDTDSLDVMFGYRHDVSSITVESVFFELSPGENEITVATDVDDGPIQIVAIWQNRWL